MTNVSRPTAGTNGDASWAQAVADALNLGGKILTSDVTTSSGSFANLTGLSFSATSGKVYNIEVNLSYECSSTSGGPVVGFDHAGGDCHLYLIYHGETSAVSTDSEEQNSTDDGGAAGVATVNTAGAAYFIRGWGVFQCTSTGTWTLRMKRNTAGTVTFRKGSAIRVVEG